MLFSKKEISELKIFFNQIPEVRKKQSLIIVILTILASFSEILSIGSIIPFLAVITSPESLFSNQILSDALNFVNLKQGDNLVLVLSLFFAFAIMISSFFRLLLLWASIYLSAKSGSDISTRIFTNNIQQPLAYHIDQNSSEIISSVITKSYAAATGVLFSAINAFSSLIIIFSILILFSLIVTEIAIYAIFAFALIYLFISKLSEKSLNKNSQKVAIDTDKSIKVTQDTIGGIRDIIIGNAEKIFIDKFYKFDHSSRMANAKIELIASSPRIIVETFGMIFLIILTYFSVEQNSDNAIQIAFLGGLALSAQRILPLVQQVYFAISKIKGSIKLLQDINYFLTLSSPFSENLANDPIEFSREIIFRNVSFSYKDSNEVLSKINLQFNKGERIGIIGETGSGKSTFVDILVGLYKPTKGRLSIDNIPLTQKNFKSWQNILAHVPQNIFLADDTIKNNIVFSSKDEFDANRFNIAIKVSLLDDFIGRFPYGYDTVIGEGGLKLSGGQRQRLGIARAIYRNPQILILDEATSALDSVTESKILDLIIKFGEGVTIFLITHRVSSLKAFDKIVVVDEGSTSIKDPSSYFT